MRSKKEVEAIVSGMGVFVAIISSLVELVKKLGGSIEMIYRLATPEGSETLEAIARIIVQGMVKAQSQFLKLISGGVSLTVDAVDGTEILADAKDVFPGGIDSDFKNWGADEPGQLTAKTPVEVHEMKKDATFSQMFGELNSDVRKLCLTQHQIKNFVKKHRNWLRTDGYATFFLFESNGNFFVAYVYFRSSGGLFVLVYQFEISYVWNAERRHRVVVPQLA
ncbi:MAG: hypothetical protein Q8O59_01620 [bacterium]|nr:hypothetical protein [bacterium]